MLPPYLVIVPLVHYDVFNLSPDHVIKSRAIARLGPISSLPHNLVNLQFLFLKIDIT